MDLDTCSGCSMTGPAEDMEVCHECGVPLCDSCGSLKNNKLLCKNCLEEEQAAEFEAELDAEMQELIPEGVAVTWSEDEDGKKDK